VLKCQHPRDKKHTSVTSKWSEISLQLRQRIILDHKILSTLNKICMNVYLLYTGCHRRNGPNFGRVFLMLNYTDITQNTYIQSWTVTEIMAREKCGHLAFPRTVHLQLCSTLTVREECGTHFCDGTSSAQCDKIAFHYCQYVQCLVILRTTVTWVRVFL